MITTTLQGRLGNQFYQIAMLLAYAKKHNLEYYIPDTAYHCDGRKMYFPHLAMGPELTGMQEYHEQPIHAVPKGDGTFLYNVPVYQDLPRMDNVKFVGYWQSFKYFDDYRDYILEKFQLPYEMKKGHVGIHCRFGDFLQLRDKHPEVPIAYYRNAVQHFYDQGYRVFHIYSDNPDMAADVFSPTNFPPTEQFTGYLISIQRDKTELQDVISLSECEHQILCYSTFGFIAAWLNRNPNKQVIIPPSRFVFSGSNTDFIPSHFTQLEFQ